MGVWLMRNGGACTACVTRLEKVMSKLYCMIMGLWLLPLIANAQVCQTATIPATTPTVRFTVNANGTVIDKKTGLMWKKCSEGLSGMDCTVGVIQTQTWWSTLQNIQTMNTTSGFAGFTDWRIPNVKELRSIVEKQCYNPAINLTVFPNTAPTYFWTSSSSAWSGDYAWYIDFGSGRDGWDHKPRYNQTRLVRGGQ